MILSTFYGVILMCCSRWHIWQQALLWHIHSWVLLWSREVSKPTWSPGNDYLIPWPCHMHFERFLWIIIATNWAELTLRQSFLCHIFGQYTLSTSVLLNVSALDNGTKSYISFLSFLILKTFIPVFRNTGSQNNIWKSWKKIVKSYEIGLELESGDQCITLWMYVKATDVYTLEEWALW